jgi:DNA-binding MarR family transcriptional regulator
VVEQLPSPELGILLALAYQQFVEELHGELARHGIRDIRPSYGYVLRTIEQEPLNQRELATRLGVTEQAIGKLVSEMVRRKFLRRTVDAADARARRLVLGARGEEVLRHARRFHARFEAQLTDELGTSVTAMRAVLAHVIERGGPEARRARLRLV